MSGVHTARRLSASGTVFLLIILAPAHPPNTLERGKSELDVKPPSADRQRDGAWLVETSPLLFRLALLSVGAPTGVRHRVGVGPMLSVAMAPFTEH